MSKRIKKVLIILIPSLTVMALVFVLLPSNRAFFGSLASNSLSAGMWEDDSKNWSRAFHEDQPTEVEVVHSKYWKSNHFTDEFIYFFEIEATPEWRDAFLKKRNLVPVPSSLARSFRTNTHTDMTPDWFAPDPVSKYDVYDANGFGSVWIDRVTGHIFFYDIQV